MVCTCRSSSSSFLPIGSALSSAWMSSSLQSLYWSLRALKAHGWDRELGGSHCWQCLLWGSRWVCLSCSICANGIWNSCRKLPVRGSLGGAAFESDLGGCNVQYKPRKYVLQDARSAHNGFDLLAVETVALQGVETEINIADGEIFGHGLRGLAQCTLLFAVCR